MRRAGSGGRLGVGFHRRRPRSHRASASNRASSTSPRSSPSTCSGSGRSQRTEIRSRSCACRSPRPRNGLPVKRCGEARHLPRPDAHGRCEVEPEVELGAAREPHRDRAGVRVGIAVGDDQERGAADPVDLDRGVEAGAALDEESGGDAHEGQAAGRPRPGARPSEWTRGPAPRRSHPRREGEARAVDPADGDPPGAAGRDRAGDALAASRGRRGSPGARARTLVPPAGHEAGRRAVGAVDRLVVAAVAGEDDDRVHGVAARGLRRARPAWPWLLPRVIVRTFAVRPSSASTASPFSSGVTLLARGLTISAICFTPP